MIRLHHLTPQDPSAILILVKVEMKSLFYAIKPSLSIKILSINNFTIKLLSKRLSDLSIEVHLESSL